MFSICLDDSTDVTPDAVFARFPSGNIIKEELIKLMALSEKTRVEDFMNELKNEFIEFGAPIMIEKNIGFLKPLK